MLLIILFITVMSFAEIETVIPMVKGGVDFCRQVKDALDLLEQKAPEVLGFVNNNIKIIQIYNTSGMCVSCKPPTFQLSPKPANLEKYWLASCISHDCYHAYLYQLNKFKLNGVEPSYESYSGFDAERQCNTFQLQVLKRIQAPSNIIKYMETLNGEHCDVNGDGKCDGKDYQIRQKELVGTPLEHVVIRDADKVCEF